MATPTANALFKMYYDPRCDLLKTVTLTGACLYIYCIMRYILTPVLSWRLYKPIDTTASNHRPVKGLSIRPFFNGGQ